jgi:predicted HTH transcriptional regulator
VSRYILDLIARGEHQNQDFKFEINDARKIAKTLVAFSNADGGKLLIGVKDNGKIAGVRTEEEYYMIEAAASMYCKPEVPFKLKKWNVHGKTVLEVDIPKGERRPYLAKTQQDKWLPYIRVNDRNFLANSIQVRVWKNEKRRRGVYIEFRDKEKILLDYLRTSPISLTRYCKISGLKRKDAADILVRLINLGVIRMQYGDKEIRYILKEKP